jgi:hypothetical protein
MPGERLADGRQKNLVAERLLQKVDSSLLHGFDRHGNVGVAGDDDDRERDATLFQPPDELDAVDAGHAHVRDDASGFCAQYLFEEGRSGFMQTNRKSFGRQQEGQ